MPHSVPSIKLYVYQHCPYCVVARSIFALKNVEFHLEYLLHDDEDTPNKLIGKKLLPILIKEDGSAMGESMDIVRYIDENYGDKKVVKPSSAPEIQQWIQSMTKDAWVLLVPRFVMTSFPEFESESAKKYYTAKMEGRLGKSFEDALANTDTHIKVMEEKLRELEPLVQNRDMIEGVTEDDILLWAHLRNLSVVKGLTFPNEVLNYMKDGSAIFNMGMFFDLAV